MPAVDAAPVASSTAPSTATASNAAALTLQGIWTGDTFARQDELPRLPIPPLADTCERYLAALAPLQTPEQHQRTRHAVEHFLHRDGPLLQERLHQYASTRTSYIADFWNDAYLQATDSVVLNLNPFFILEYVLRPCPPWVSHRACPGVRDGVSIPLSDPILSSPETTQPLPAAAS